MKKHLRTAIAAILVLGVLSLHAQTAAAPATKTTSSRKVRKTHETEDQKAIRELREQMVAQQAALQSQIDALKEQNAAKDAALTAAQSQAATAQSQAAAAQAQATAAQTQAAGVSSSVDENTKAISTVKSGVNDVKTTSATLVTANKKLADAIDAPVSLRYKGVKITPVAFFAFESVWRQKAINAGINTPFTSTPFENSGNAYTSEFNFTGRQSRIGGLFEGDAGPVKLKGYIEADFLSSGTTSNNNQSNSYTLRQRQFWGQAALPSGFTVTGGQMWSLVTETKKGTDNGTENLPANIDAQYNVGFSWLRLPAIRFQQKVGGITTLALSLENAQITGFDKGGANAPANYFFGGTGNNGGLYNNTTTYTNNVAPDFVVKAAFDPAFGHFEVGGALRFMRDRYYPNETSTPASSAGATNNTKLAGGVFANARVKAGNYATIGLHFLGGDGVGRYGTAGLSDATIHPDGTLEPLHAYQGLFSLELHPARKLDIFAYAGSEYVQRTTYLNANGQQVGYATNTQNNSSCYTEGLPSGAATSPAGSCSALTRDVFEGTAGFTYRFYNSPKYGRFQYEVQYSYLSKGTWAGIGGSPKATNNMLFTSMRYYIP